MSDRPDVVRSDPCILGGPPCFETVAEVRAVRRTGACRAQLRRARGGAFASRRQPRVVKILLDENFPLRLLGVLSRVRQSRPLVERVTVWQAAVQDLSANPRAETLFGLTDDGRLLPWREIGSARVR
jgi:hypothetical protein